MYSSLSKCNCAQEARKVAVKQAALHPGVASLTVFCHFAKQLTSCTTLTSNTIKSYFTTEHEIISFARKWMELEITVLNKTNHIQEDKS